jgi:hypothetical protein
MKKVLAVHYSQTGQAAAVVDSIVAPLEQAADVQVTRLALDVTPPYPHPWPFWPFLDTFPECVHLDPPPLAAAVVAQLAQLRAQHEHERFDLVLIGFPVWFLAPAPAVTAFLRHPDAQALLRDTPVITVSACRNMWVMAQETVKGLLSECGARHIDHVALIDAGHALATFITTPRWVLTGRRNAFWGLPAAGVSADEIRAARRFGVAIAEGLRADQERSGRPLLGGLRACVVDQSLVASEKIGQRSFRVWGKLLRALGRAGAPQRRVALALYVVFLLTMIVTVVPLSMLAKTLLRPVLRSSLERVRLQYEAPSGSGEERMPTMSRADG